MKTKTTRQAKPATTAPRKTRKGGARRKSREIVNPNAAGLDIAVKGDLWVAVSEEACAEPVRAFSPLTAGLREMVSWMKACGVETVAMEATGRYWLSVYLACREAGLAVCLANPQVLKGLARKSDRNDCEWLRYLHSLGLLKASFIPEDQVLALRTLSRHRENLIQQSKLHVQLMQKALDEQNIHLHHVISDLTGASGLAILEAILAGERDAQKLAALRHKSIKAPAQKVVASLEGRWNEEHLFVLRQADESWQMVRRQMAACDEHLLGMAGRFTPKLNEEELAAAKAEIRRRGAKRKVGATVNGVPTVWQDLLHQQFGIDLTQVPGIGILAVFVLWTELGTNWARSFASAAKFASWLGLCPNHEISGGKVLRRRTRPVQSRLRNLLKCCAQSLASSQSHLGAQYRAIRGRLGPAQANTAMAHKLARILWHLVAYQQNYDESFLRKLDQLQLLRAKKRIEKRAADLGYKLVALDPKPEPTPEETEAAA
jgi:transposase